MNPRYLWLTAGIVIVIVTGIVAAPNLREIYSAEKDFVIGGMLSLAGFAFGKAVDRSAEARERWLQVNGVYDGINEIKGRLRSAVEALWKITDPAAATVVIDCRKQLVEAIRTVTRLHNALAPADGAVHFPPAQQEVLGKLGRDIDAAVDRLYSSRMELLPQLDVKRDEAEWALFFVLVDDLRNVQERLQMVGSKQTNVPVATRLYVIESDLRAAQRRGTEFATVLDDRSLKRPNTFDIMCRDVADALTELGKMSATGPTVPVRFSRRSFGERGQTRPTET